LLTKLSFSLELYSPTQRTLLLFVIRDHLGTTPLSNLQATLSQDLHRIWDSLAKPQGLADTQLEDYFDLAFEALPHKVRRVLLYFSRDTSFHAALTQLDL